MQGKVGYRVAFDVGGTFTDLVLECPDGQIHTAKTLTTYPDPSAACLAGLDEIMRQAGASWADVDEAVHGTTLGSNVVIERKGVGIAAITTSGFGDVLHIGRQKRYQIYDLQLEKPDPLVDRPSVFEVRERMRFDGTVLQPLVESDVRDLAERLRDDEVTSIAVCLLHSYANSEHEDRIKEIFSEVAPGIAVSLSSDVSPKFREFERMSTTVANAYLIPSVRDYLERLVDELRKRGFGGELFIMQSSGGLAAATAMARYPVRMIESGPAAGALAAALFGALCGSNRVVAFDMGGTTAKMALALDGTPQMVNQFELHKIGHASGSGIPMNVRSLDLTEIGSGGGSIARPNLGTIQVGPDSAGSQPGPACYGKGGIEATVTDANLVLGYLNPEGFAGGSMTLDVAAAERAIRDGVADPLGMTVAEAAWGIHRMVNLSMELATRVVSIERGHDPRGLTLVATGGSGPVHCCRLAQALGLPTVVIPAAAGVASALGMLSAEIKFDIDRTLLSELQPSDLPLLDSMLAEMEREVRTNLIAATGSEPARIEREVELRYKGQGYELTIPLRPGSLVEPDALAALRSSFNDEYSQRYGFANEEADLEATTWKVTAFGIRRPLEVSHVEQAGGDAAEAQGTRSAYFPELGGYVPVPIFRRQDLRAGSSIVGPAIVEDAGSTTVLPPSTTALVDNYGSLVVNVP